MPATPTVPDTLPSRFRLGEWIVDSALGELLSDTGAEVVAASGSRYATRARFSSR